MNSVKNMPLLRLVSLSLLLVVLASGCGKKSAPAATASEATPVAVAAPAAAPAAQAAALSAAEQSNVNARMAAAKAAMQSKDYEKARAALFIPVNRQAPVAMSGQELMSLNATKAAYMNQLFAAAAAGDAKAKATLESLRQNQNR